jgi:hypothetical protein
MHRKDELHRHGEAETLVRPWGPSMVLHFMGCRALRARNDEGWYALAMTI